MDYPSNTYLEVQRLTNNDGSNNAYGRSLSSTINSRGDKLLVSGTKGYGSISSNTPAVYVFTNVDYDIDKEENDDGSIFSSSVHMTGGQIWTQLAKLQCPNANILDQFGSSVDISETTIVVGASYTDNGVGAAYVYDTSVSSSSSSLFAWTQTAALSAHDGTISDFFGISVGVNGNYIFIGASGQSSTGAVYVFKSSQVSGSSGSSSSSFRSWSQQAKLASNVKGGFFGRSVAVSSAHIVVSSYGENQQAGSIYVYNNIGDSWTQTAKLTPPDLNFGDLFGFDVDVNNNHILATSIYDNAKGHIINIINIIIIIIIIIVVIIFIVIIIIIIYIRSILWISLYFFIFTTIKDMGF